MTLFGNQSIRPGTTITRETWVVVRNTDLPERLKHTEGDFGTREEALEKAAHLKAIGMPGRVGVRHEMTITHADPVEWLEQTLVPGEGAACTKGRSPARCPPT